MPTRFPLRARHFAALKAARIPFALLAACGLAQAAEPQVVAVTALREPAPLSETVAEVTVLSRADLDRAAGLTLTDLLARQPGLQGASSGGPGASSELFIRGLEARHTVLLVDGVRVGSATLGEPSLDNLPVALIDHIEIVRGPLSSLYGSDAAGGVVQVFTRRGRAGGLAAAGELTLGSLGSVQARAGLSTGGDGFDLALDGQHAQDRGFSATNPQVPYGNFNPDRDGFDQDAFDLRAGWQPTSDWRVEAFALGSSGHVHFDDGPDADSRALLVNRVQSLAVHGRIAGEWRTELTASNSSDDYATEASASPYSSLGSIGSIERQITWSNTVATPAGTVMGVLETRSQRVRRPDTPFDVSQRDIHSAALALDGHARGLSWQASLRRDHNSQFGDPTTGAAALAWKADDHWRLGASYGTSFVAPSFNQLYYPGYGNPALQPERGRSAEVNASWTSGLDQVRTTFYRNRIRGFITSGEQPDNISHARIDGVTLAADAHWQALRLQTSLDHLDARGDADANGHALLLPRRAPDTLRADLSWTRDASVAGAALAASSRRYDDAANTGSLPSFTTLDLYAERHIAPGWSLGLRANNVAGRAYETAHGYNQPGRTVYATLRYTSP